VPAVTVSGSRNVLASTSAPAIISVPSTVDASAAGHGNEANEMTATAAAPDRRIAGWGRRSASDTNASLHCRIFGRKTGFHPRLRGGGHFPENADD
jgi:hypothetical protein